MWRGRVRPWEAVVVILGRLADALTLARFGLGAALVVTLGRGEQELSAVVLVAAWITDFLDGRLARAGSGSRLGDWDFPADTVVGAGVLLGLGLDGYVDLRLAVVASAVLGAAYALTRNPALSQILQAIGYGAFLWRLWARSSPIRWLPVGVIAVIGVADRRRLVEETLPGFFGGVAAVVRLRRPSLHDD